MLLTIILPVSKVADELFKWGHIIDKRQRTAQTHKKAAWQHGRLARGQKKPRARGHPVGWGSPYLHYVTIRSVTSVTYL